MKLEMTINIFLILFSVFAVSQQVFHGPKFRRPRSVDMKVFTQQSLLNEWSYISSPGYPSEYDNNLHYKWHLQALPYHLLEIELLKMDIDLSRGCRYDYLLFTNVYQTRSKVCGLLTTKLQFLSLTDEAEIIFYTDNTETGSVFQLRFRSIKVEIPQCISSFVVDQILTASTEMMEIHSRGYPFRYPNDIVQQWLILNPNQTQTLTLSTVDMELEESKNCVYDYLAVYVEKCPHSEPDHKVCGNKKLSLKLENNHGVFIRFSSDQNRNKRGFKIKFQLEEKSKLEKETENHFDSVVMSVIIGGFVSAFILIFIISNFVFHHVNRKRMRRRTFANQGNNYRQHDQPDPVTDETLPSDSRNVFTISSQTAIHFRSNIHSMATAPSLDVIIQPPSYQSLFDDTRRGNEAYDHNEVDLANGVNVTRSDFDGIINSRIILQPYSGSTSFTFHGSSLLSNRAAISPVNDPDFEGDRVFSPPPSYDKLFGDRS